MARLLCCCVMLCAHAVSAQPTPAPPQQGPLGPGPHPWKKVPGEQVGLDSQRLAAASDAYGNVGTPLCLAVVKDGQLIVDSEYGFGSHSHKIESMSAGKTMTAAMVGVAVERGLFDLHTPLIHYGVEPHANWSKSGVDWYPKVTPYHLITQSTGRGSVEPGTALTYDSDEYIQHLSFLLNTTSPAGQTAREWATSQFAVPLGLPDLYAFERADPAGIGDTPLLGGTQISAGGDQPIVCRDIARVGQLLLNKGLWPSSSGETTRMLSEDYVESMFQPQHASLPYDKCAGHMCKQYSYLSYVSTEEPIPANASCTLNNTGLVQVRGLPTGSLLAMGALGRYMMVVPEEKLVVVAFGSSTAHLQCPAGAQGAWSTDEGLVLSQIWGGLRNATLPPAAQQPSAVQPGTPSAGGPGPGPGHRHPGPPPRPPPGHNPHRPHWPPPRQAGTGACYCYCPAGQAIGRCMNNVASVDACSALVDSSEDVNASATHFCPPTSLLYDCHDEQVDCPATLYNSMQLTSSTACSGTSQPLEKAQQCNYAPTAYSECYFLANTTCEHSPYFPLPRHPPPPQTVLSLIV